MELFLLISLLYFPLAMTMVAIILPTLNQPLTWLLSTSTTAPIFCHNTNCNTKVLEIQKYVVVNTFLYSMYKLPAISLYQQCNHTYSLKAFFEDFLSGPVKIAVVGCGCTEATIPVAEISHHWNVSQVGNITQLNAYIYLLQMMHVH